MSVFIKPFYQVHASCDKIKRSKCGQINQNPSSSLTLETLHQANAVSQNQQIWKFDTTPTWGHSGRYSQCQPHSWARETTDDCQPVETVWPAPVLAACSHLHHLLGRVIRYFYGALWSGISIRACVLSDFCSMFWSRTICELGSWLELHVRSSKKQLLFWAKI